ncbi:lytic murein transglycosylase [Patescibacteria group bacterium AH-259-L07]|nr:lytic murein transglycosylase [Patescibacteria group bacterium AH-259-L07]
MKFISMVIILIACFSVVFAQDDVAVSNQLIKIHVRARILEFFENDSLVFAFPIRVGKMDRPTPLGTAYVYIKRNPPIFHYIDPESGERKILYEAECGDGIKKINYKNMRALGLRYEKAIIDPKIARELNLGKHPQRYSIHSTTCSETVGLAISNGCIGMTIPDMLELYPRVNEGTPVVITNDSTLVYWQRGEYKKAYEKLFDDLEKEGYTREELENIFSDSRIKFYEHIYKRRSEEEKKKIRELQKKHKEQLEKELEEEVQPVPSQRYFKESLVQKGKEFLAEHDSLLISVEEIYGVDKEIIVSLFQKESNFGKKTDYGFRILNVYNTYFLFHPKRSYRSWGRKELISYLIICKQNNWQPFEKYGSSAGAFGIPQFIPSSYLSYAVDGDGDGIIDLWNMVDAAHSTANYLKKHGWVNGRWNRKNSTALWKYNRDWTYVWMRAHYAKAIGWKPQEP